MAFQCPLYLPSLLGSSCTFLLKSSSGIAYEAGSLFYLFIFTLNHFLLFQNMHCGEKEYRTCGQIDPHWNLSWMAFFASL